jgi:hypothetical protein
MRTKRNLVEVFGHSPDDLSISARSLWNLGACPFTNSTCTKINHDQTITYGTCSVTSPYGDVIICPNRLYSDGYKVLLEVCSDAFGTDIPFKFYGEYVQSRNSLEECVVALGKNSGREVQVGGSFSMDWVLARIRDGKLVEYIGVEVQSIDITGNYRDAWHAYKNMSSVSDRDNLPSSQHGLNWANVHKRLIPQIIRKSVVYSRSKLVSKGLYFIVPEIVYLKFEDVIGSDIPLVAEPGHDVITVHTYALGDAVPHGSIRDLNLVRSLRFSLEDFAGRFISGPNLPDGDALDQVVKRVLGVV